MEHQDIDQLMKELEDSILPLSREPNRGREAEITTADEACEAKRNAEQTIVREGKAECEGLGDTIVGLNDTVDAHRNAVEQFAVNEQIVDDMGSDVDECEDESADAGTVRVSAWQMKGYDGLLAGFLVPILLMLIIFIQRGIFPFGDHSFLRTDMYHQYAPFFSEFQEKLTHGGSLFYSWNIGMGVNFSALYAYYLASPVNWLLFFCPKGLVLEFMTYMIVLKIGLSGLTMTYYLHKHSGCPRFGAVFFGIFYAMSGYMAAYSWNIMWLDCIFLFPLIVLGLERLVRQGKGMLYCITLGLSILSNYYISIMTCIFMVLYFVALLILDDEMSWGRFWRACLRFGLYSLLAGGMAAAVLLPEIFALQSTASGDFNFPTTFTQYFSIFDMIARHIANVETEIGLDHWPNIYCGVAVLMFFLLYLAGRQIKGKEKAVYCSLLLFFFASFSFNVLNFIWHGFHYPNSLPARQSYLYIFLMLFVCYRAYENLEKMPWSYTVCAFWGAVSFVILAQKLVTAEHFHFIVYYVAILFLALYLGAIALYRKGVQYQKLALLFALVVVSLESAINMAVTSVSTVSRSTYLADNAATRTLVASVTPNSTFYRVEKVTRKTKNDGAWLNFPSVSLFSSTANADLSKFFKKLGCESSTNAYSITGSTPLVDMLFAVKYGVYSKEADYSELRTLIAQEGEMYLYENEYTLPLGVFVDDGFADRWNQNMSNPADVQNSFADAAGASAVLHYVTDSRITDKTLRFTPAEDGEYYAYISNKKIEKVTLKTAKETKTFNNVSRGFLLELGYCTAGEEVTLTAEDTTETMQASVYRFSEKGLASVYDALMESPWKLTNWTDTTLAGTIDCKEKGTMMTTIPYDEGWTIVVDGIKQTPIKLFDAFIGVSLTPGHHTIEMEYCPQGLKLGMAISIGSAALLALIAAGGHFYRKYQEDMSYGD